MESFLSLLGFKKYRTSKSKHHQLILSHQELHSWPVKLPLVVRSWILQWKQHRRSFHPWSLIHHQCWICLVDQEHLMHEQFLLLRDLRICRYQVDQKPMKTRSLSTGYLHYTLLYGFLVISDKKCPLIYYIV